MSQIGNFIFVIFSFFIFTNLRESPDRTLRFISNIGLAITAFSTVVLVGTALDLFQ